MISWTRGPWMLKNVGKHQGTTSPTCADVGRYLRVSDGTQRSSAFQEGAHALHGSEVIVALAEGAALGTVVLIRDAGRPVKANLSIDAGTLAVIDEAAKRIGETRSGAIRRLAEVGIPLLG